MSDVWPYVAGAYAVTVVLLIGLCAGVLVSLRRWSRRAREEER